MGNRSDLDGSRFGRWTVGKVSHLNKLGEIYWHCICDCGKGRPVKAGSLRRGRSTSCGCAHKEAVTSHGQTGTRTFTTWQTMLQRCGNPNAPDYHRYGGRGIAVCKRWQDSFAAFLEDMGERPTGMTLDRENVNRNYTPKNCRWATLSRQQRNRADRVLMEWKGETLCLADWSDKVGISSEILGWRLQNGWTVQKAMTAPVTLGRGKKAK